FADGGPDPGLPRSDGSYSFGVRRFTRTRRQAQCPSCAWRSARVALNEGKTKTNISKKGEGIVSIIEKDNIGAFCRHDPIVLPGAAQGPLAGLTFAAKDIFDIAG